MSNVKVAIYYSMSGSNYQLARWAEGAKELGAEVRVLNS